MKKYLQILFFSTGLLITSIAFSQPVLTQSGVALAPGDVISNAAYYNHVSHGNAGANQTWNLSSLLDSASSGGNVVISSSLAIADSFPGATIAYYNSGSYDFYNVDSSVMQRVGSGTDSTVSYTNINPEDILRFPLNYNDSYSDQYRSILHLTGGGSESYTGTATVTADGYGTVITPNHTYTNAMRVHLLENYIDSNDASGTLFILTFHKHYYKWYVNGYHWPVAELDSLVLIYLGTAYPSYYTYYLSSFTGLNNLTALNSLNAFPNPSSEYINLDVNLSSSYKLDIKVFNALGSEMEISALHNGDAGDNRYRLDVRHFPQGIYFACIMLDGILTSTRQFVVSK